MKKQIFKYSFLVLILFTLILCGCKVDKNFIVLDFKIIDEVNNVYIKQYSNDTESVLINNIIQLNDKKAELKYYNDEGYTNETNNNEILLLEGDNYLYVSIVFSDDTQINLTLNFYRLKLFKVSFVTNCKTKIEDQYVQENDVVDRPTIKLEKAGYAFKSWNYNFKTPVTSDLTIEAEWKENSYVVTYNTNGGEIENDFAIVIYNQPYQLDVPTKEGYTFVGWSYNGKLITSDKWIISEEITVDAVWEVETRTYEIEYIIVGATGPNLQRTYTNKEEVILRTPYKKGYKFIGWYYESNFSGERIYSIPKGTEGNITLYSKWQRFTLESSTISFLGDSITTFYDPNSQVNSLYKDTNQYYYPIYSKDVKQVEQTWWYKVIEETQTKLLVNESWSGTSCYNNGNENNSAAMNYNRINNLKGSEIIIVFIGTNDNVNGVSITNFTNAYNKLLKRVKEVCNDSFVFCCTLGYSAYSKYEYKEETRIEYNNIIKTLAENNDCEVIDIASVQTIENYTQLLGDSLHPNQYGMQVYADKAIDVLKKYLCEYY